jgi:hypothetical protein
MNNKLTNFRIDENTRKQFHIWCIRNGTTIGENLREHIQDTLAEETSSWSQVIQRSTSPKRWEDSY